MNNSNENLDIVGKYHAMVLDENGNITWEYRSKNSITTAMKEHMARLLGDDNGSGTEYNSTAKKVQGSTSQQSLCDDLGGTADYPTITSGSEPLAIEFKGTYSASAVNAIGYSSSDVDDDLANLKFTLSSKVTGTPSGGNTTWTSAKLWILSGFAYSGAGTASGLHVADATGFTANCTQYDSFVITWTLTLQDG